MNNQERDEAIADLRKRVEELEAQLNAIRGAVAAEPAPEPAKEG